MGTSVKTDHSIVWFVNRVGKIVFETDNSCYCKDCKHAKEYGFIIEDVDQAQHLKTCQDEMGLGFYDKKET